MVPRGLELDDEERQLETHRSEEVDQGPIDVEVDVGAEGDQGHQEGACRRYESQGEAGADEPLVCPHALDVADDVDDKGEPQGDREEHSGVEDGG